MQPILWGVGGGVIVLLIALVGFLLGRQGGGDTIDAGSERMAAGDIAVASGQAERSSGARSSQSGSRDEGRTSAVTTKPISSIGSVSKPVGASDKKPAKWGGDAEANGSAEGAVSAIPFNDRAGLTFGPPGCPVLVSGKQVWDIATSRPVTTLEGSYEGRGLSALSPDGTLFAAVDKSPNQKATVVIVWDTKTGEQLFTVPGDSERYVDVLLLAGGRLILGGRLSSELRIWDARSGKQLKTLELSDHKRLGSGNTGLSLDGQYLAMAAHDQLVVIKTDTGRTAAVMEAPKDMEPNSGRAGRRGGAARVSSTDAVFVYAWLQSVKFSPDNQELAAVSTHPRSRVMCWDNHGKLVFDEPFYTERRAFWENTLQWFPDRGAWLIKGDVFDREAGRIVLSIRERFAQDLRLHVVDDDRLIGNFPHNPSQLEVLEIPWKDIRESLTHMNNEGPAHLSPAAPVDLRLEIDSLRGDGNAAAQAIQQALSRRLARDGVRVARGSETYFRLKFAEKAGDRLPIYERQSPFDLRGHDTGRTAVEAKGSLVVELIVPGQGKPVWRDVLNVSSARSFREEITNAALRRSMLDNLSRQINELNFPYFIPESDDLLALPVVIK